MKVFFFLGGGGVEMHLYPNYAMRIKKTIIHFEKSVKIEFHCHTKRSTLSSENVLANLEQNTPTKTKKHDPMFTKM